ncbi:MAG: hypothetical protein ASARMPREDX12_003193 [Alectoria sarmentosa]|nr:MAG: hypothetical protein ASARMPREDX12_003193 [Alectoria sarmentosa]
MDRSDGRNPFDPATYNTPDASIQTMLELRAFCADFFEKHVRTNANLDNEDMASFLNLVTHSPMFFVRAREVIPELQATEVEPPHLSDSSHNVQIFLYATRALRGAPGKKWEFFPEESAWTKLVKDGMGMFLKNLANEGKGHKKQASDASIRSSRVNPTVLEPGKAESKPSDTTLHSLSNVDTKLEGLPKKLDLSDIPTFVPRSALGPEELVWSPTSGSRQRRPDEIYQPSPGAHPVNTPQFSQGISPNATSAYNLRTQYLFHGSRDFSDSPTKSHRRSYSLNLTPSPQFKSTISPLNPAAVFSSRSQENSNPKRHRRNNLEETPFPDSVDRMMETATTSQDPNSQYLPSSHYDTTAYPVTDLGRTNSPTQFKGPQYPSNQARGVYGAEPFSAPPSVPGYGDLHQTGQGMYGGPPSPFQGQLGPFQSRPKVASFHSQTGQGIYGGPPSPFQGQLGPFQSRPNVASLHSFPDQVPHVPNLDIWATQPPKQRRGALPNQMPNQIIQPIPQMMAQSQIPPSMDQATSSETFSVPPQGSMPALDYWNMLHQRETEIRTRLGHANRPMTGQEYKYLSSLGEARITAVATQMPARGGMSKGKWQMELGRTLRSIWKTGPGGMGFSPLVVARKMDFEKAVQREIELTSRERRYGEFKGPLNRADGASGSEMVTVSHWAVPTSARILHGDSDFRNSMRRREIG